MSPVARFCPTRRNLEEVSSLLTCELSSLASKLMTSIAADHRAFNITSQRCGEIRTQLKESRRRLQAHRSQHGC